jgi:D-glycero-beta-D-manno-heptose 1-phosphate adenylyltransferase
MIKKVVVNGVFDIVHIGHIELLKYAKSLGDHVLVLIDADKEVKKLKGPLRPINNQEERKLLLESLRYVDEVKVFNTQQELVDEYKGRPITGEQYAKEIEFFKKTEHSTTGTIHRIINR